LIKQIAGGSMDKPESNHPESNNSDPNNTGDDEIMKSSVNTSFVMPVALLIVLLVIPFTLNSFLHILASKNEYVYPVIMKIPLDNIVVKAPTDAKQFESFEIKLRVNTDQLADVINEIISISSTNATLQGITGYISPKMQAEITGENFAIENPGPQKQSYLFNDATEWTWRVTPHSSGTQKIKIKMHVTSTENDKQNIKVIELAEANVIVDSDSLMWIVYNWWILLLIVLALFGGWKILRRYNN